MATSNQTLKDSLKLIYLVKELGEYALVPDGAIVNIGGVAGPNFTVGGKGLMLSDGTSSDGSSVNIVKPDFQTIYGNSVGEAFIDFTSGKDFVLQAVNNNQFRFDADTGNVTISGNLVVQGETTTVVTASVQTDRVAIRQSAGNYVPFTMEPLPGVTPTSNVVDIKTARGGTSVFTIGPTGQTYIHNLVAGTINGVNLEALVASVNAHLDLTSTDVKHTAEQISVKNTGGVEGSTVQEALESLSTKIGNVISNVHGYEHEQLEADDTWYIAHNGNTRRIQVTIWDENDEQILADTILLANEDVVVAKFNMPITGRAILMLF